MKRVNKLLFLILAFFINVVYIYAADFTSSVSGTSKIYPGESFTITFGVKNVNTIYGLSSSLSYDKSKLSIKSSKGLNGFTLTLGSNAVVDSSSGKGGSISLFSITFKALDSFVPGEDTTISFSQIEAGDGDNLYSSANTSIKISMLEPKSKNNKLSSLTLNDEQLDLSKKTHTITVDNDVTSINIAATPEDTKSKVNGTGKKTLKLYSNKFTITITSESGAKNTYTIIVIRKDENGNTTKPKDDKKEEQKIEEKTEVPELKSIVVDGYDISFSPNIFDYNIKVTSDTSKLDIEAKSEDGIKVEINNPELVIGENLITIKVTNDTGESREYKIIAFRPEKEVIEVCNNKENNKLYILIIAVEFIIILLLIGYILLKDMQRRKKLLKTDVLYIDNNQ